MRLAFTSWEVTEQRFYIKIWWQLVAKASRCHCLSFEPLKIVLPDIEKCNSSLSNFRWLPFLSKVARSWLKDKEICTKEGKFTFKTMEKWGRWNIFPFLFSHFLISKAGNKNLFVIEILEIRKTILIFKKLLSHCLTTAATEGKNFFGNVSVSVIFVTPNKALKSWWENVCLWIRKGFLKWCHSTLLNF